MLQCRRLQGNKKASTTARRVQVEAISPGYRRRFGRNSPAQASLIAMCLDVYCRTFRLGRQNKHIRNQALNAHFDVYFVIGHISRLDEMFQIRCSGEITDGPPTNTRQAKKDRT